LSPGDNIVSWGQFCPRVILAISGLLAISLTFYAENDPKIKKYSRDFLPSDPGLRKEAFCGNDFKVLPWNTILLCPR
jgi:hypothetical protein